MQHPLLPEILGIKCQILRRSKNYKLMISAVKHIESILNLVRFATKHGLKGCLARAAATTDHMTPRILLPSHNAARNTLSYDRTISLLL